MCHINTLKITEKDCLLYHSAPEADGNCTDWRKKLGVWKQTDLHLSTGMSFFSQPSLQNTSAWNSEGRAQHCQIFVWGFVTKENELLILMKHLITFWIRTKWKAPVILKAHIKIYMIQTISLLVCVCLSATLEDSRPYTAG